MVRLLAPFRRRRSATCPELIGPAIQRREQQQAKDRLLAQARRRSAAHLYDGPAR